MLQKTSSMASLKVADCKCLFQDTFATECFKKNVIRIDLSTIEECFTGIDFKTHLNTIQDAFVICLAPCVTNTIEMLTSLNYTLISTDVLFEYHYNDPIDLLIADSDYSIISGKQYAFDKKSARIQEFITELARTSHYGKNKNISFDAIYHLYEERLMQSWNNLTITIFAAVDFAGALSGFISVREDKDELHIDYLAVHASIRRKGIAQELIKTACLYAQEKQKNMYVKTQAENIASIRLYEKAGFLQKKFNLVYHKIKD